MVLIVQSSKILQITDVHLDIQYNTKGDRKQMCHLNPDVVDKLGQFGDYMCDAPKVSFVLFKGFIHYLLQIVPLEAYFLNGLLQHSKMLLESPSTFLGNRTY